MDIAELDRLEAAGTRLKALRFKTTCMTTKSAAVFSADLKGGRRFSVVPVMPKDEYGNQLTPDSVDNGAEGYLVLRVSENTMVALGPSTVELTARPALVAFAKTAEEARAIEARG